MVKYYFLLRDYILPTQTENRPSYLQYRYYQLHISPDEFKDRAVNLIKTSRVEAERLATDDQTERPLQIAILQQLIISSYGLEENNSLRYRVLAFYFIQANDIGNALPYFHLFMSTDRALAQADAMSMQVKQAFPLYQAILKYTLMLLTVNDLPDNAQYHSYFECANLLANINYQPGLMHSLRRCMELNHQRLINSIWNDHYFREPIHPIMRTAFINYCANLLTAGAEYFNHWLPSFEYNIANIFKRENRALLETLINNEKLQQTAPLFCARGFNLLAEDNPAYYRNAALLYARAGDSSGLTYCARIYFESNRESVERELSDRTFVNANLLYANQLRKFLDEANTGNRPKRFQQFAGNRSIFHAAARSGPCSAAAADDMPEDPNTYSSYR